MMAAIRNLGVLSSIGLGLCLADVTSLPVDFPSPLQSVAFLVAALFVLDRLPRRGVARIVYLSLTALVVLRYLSWRTLYTLHYENFASWLGTIALYLAELYGIVMFFLGVFVNLRPISRRPRPLPRDASLLPSVDVFIPSYNEDVELVKATLTAATSLRYPKDKLKVFLLDDGATLAKLSARDPDQAVVALERRATLLPLCRELGAHYLTRVDNRRAKSGNLNAALGRTTGDLLLVLDADHIPAVDFLEKTVGFFLADPKLALVQTPHFFVNPDPIEKNLQTFEEMPSESSMFYGAVQPGLDFWEAAFFCGSAALLRRQALVDCGGFAGLTITEDAESALEMHSRGWRSVYLNQPLISGLQPETFASFVIQRTRWAQGMVQIFLLRNPFRLKGLRLWQRLAYLSSLMFWFFPFARVMFLIGPTLYLLFGLKIYAANIREILSYTVPYLVALSLSRNYLFGRLRWFLVSDVYESMQSLFSLPAILAVLRHPESPRFRITPKREHLEADFISPLSKPFYWLITLIVTASAWGVVALNVAPVERDYLIVNLFWNGFNLLILLASLGALYERRQRRANPRVPANFSAELIVGQTRYPVRVTDISIGGANIRPVGDTSALMPGLPAQLKIQNPLLDREHTITVTIANRRGVGRIALFGIRFHVQNIEDYRAVILLAYGDSGTWRDMSRARSKNPGVIRKLSFLVAVGTRQGLLHFRHLLAPGFGASETPQPSLAPITSDATTYAHPDKALAHRGERTDLRSATP